MGLATSHHAALRSDPWNERKRIGQEPPLKLQQIWAIRSRLLMACNKRDLALFNVAIESKLRACDLVRLRERDLAHGGHVLFRASVIQQQTGRVVRFEPTEQTRAAVQTWIDDSGLTTSDFLFPSRLRQSPHLSTRQYARIVKTWIRMIGADPEDYGTHALRRTKAALIYRQTKNLRALRLFLGHAKLICWHRDRLRARNGRAHRVLP